MMTPPLQSSHLGATHGYDACNGPDRRGVHSPRTPFFARTEHTASTVRARQNPHRNAARAAAVTTAGQENEAKEAEDETTPVSGGDRARRDRMRVDAGGRHAGHRTAAHRGGVSGKARRYT